MAKATLAEESSKPAAPSAGFVIIYPKTDKILYFQDETGAETSLGGTASITALTGDVSATGPGSVPATVNSVGTSSAANIHTAELAANAATSANTASTIVKRDGSGNFSAGTISAALSGNATTATTSTNFSGSLSGDVTGTQGATVVATVGGSTAANVNTATALVNTAQSGNKVLASPANGSSAPSAFRALVAADVPAIPLTTGVSGVLPVANGGTNSSAALNNNRNVISSGGAIVESAAITANRALASNSSGIPVAATTTDTELGYVAGVTSAIQTQINAKASNFTTVVVSGDVTLTANAIHLVSSAAARNLTLPAHSAGQRLYIKDSTGNCQTNNFTLIRTGGGNVEGIAASRILQTNWGSWHLFDDGTDWVFL